MTFPADHNPRGTPTCDCGYPAVGHRPKHIPRSWPICDCGAYAERHRVLHRFKPAPNGLCECGLKETNHIKPQTSKYRHEYIGIDGEGMGRNPHRYILLTAADEYGHTYTHEDMRGIRTVDALQFIIDNLQDSRVFAYGFGYDTTCILRDLPNEAIFRLLRPSLRYERGRLRPVQWNGFKLDWLQGKLTIQQKGRRVAIWDLVKFFQSTFVKALENWGIATLDIEAMKQKRGRFRERDMPKVRAYCRDECIQLAKLARKLIETHRSCDLTLRSYYGPGSTASVALSKMSVLDYRGEVPDAMVRPVACGFFGGRFEHSFMGPVSEVWGYDISSAYPYQLYQLPCLACGEWRHETFPNSRRDTLPRALSRCRTAIVRYEYKADAVRPWAPFPHRANDGSISYPGTSSGWVWLPEIQAAIRGGFTRLRILEAWIYDTPCNHRPFADIARYYRNRYEIGKDAAGIVLKLAINSCFGKTCQSKGKNPKFQCWVWAGLVTSGTRAQLLDMMRQTDLSNVIGLATDGLFSRVKLDCALPIDTGTFDLPKPLGGWEEKHYPDGMLFLKPGIYCSLSKDGDVKARGVGRKALSDARDDLIATWDAGKREYVIRVDRFFGAKTTIGPKLKRSERYGQWLKVPIHIAFKCPNRSEDMGLLHQSEPSAPYSAARLSEEKKEALIADAIDWEQP